MNLGLLVAHSLGVFDFQRFGRIRRETFWDALGARARVFFLTTGGQQLSEKARDLGRFVCASFL